MYTLRILLLSNLVQSVQAVQLTVGLYVLGFLSSCFCFIEYFFMCCWTTSYSSIKVPVPAASPVVHCNHKSHRNQIKALAE